jgi:hypothetical protein
MSAVTLRILAEAPADRRDVDAPLPIMGPEQTTRGLDHPSGRAPSSQARGLRS